MTFGEWLETENLTGNTDTEYLSAWLGWTAGQKAEREKYQELIAAAEAVIARLEMPQWNDAGPTAKVICRMRDVVERMKNDDR